MKVPIMKVPIGQLRIGELQNVLSDEQVARIEEVFKLFEGVIQWNMTQWIDGFMRDSDSESEIRHWENIALKWIDKNGHKLQSTSAKKNLLSSILQENMKDNPIIVK